MNKCIIFRFFIALICILNPIFIGTVFSQSGMWTWISGSQAAGASAVYGTQGVPSINNHPAGGYEQIQWKDKQGNFWVYGGAYSYLDDLWKYDPVTNEWTWMRGSGTSGVPANYGTMGVSNPANNPGHRLEGGAWTDTTGNLWLFGGQIQTGILSDLWEYNISTNEWIWMKGPVVPSNGVHGILGIADPLNNPGSRKNTYSTWTDNNNLWLFGGEGYDDFGTMGMLNDMMKYNISTNEWTWMKGSNQAAMLPVYGSIGIPSSTNDPGSRQSRTILKDIQGNFWLFGGDVSTSAHAVSRCNDVWKYDLISSEWTWMAGPDTVEDDGSYLTNCTFDNFNWPRARFSNLTSVPDNLGNFWIFGGNSLFGNMNDLWIFNPQSLQWNWLEGIFAPNQAGIWGTLGVPSPLNTPGNRSGGLSWWGNDNKFYMFGGMHFPSVVGLADMWVYDPDSCSIPIPSPPVAMFTAADSICPGMCTDFLNLSTNATSFQWTFNGSVTPNSTDFSPQNICYNTPGSYDVTLIAENTIGSDTVTINNYITVYPFPPSQNILQSGDTLFANPGAANYQWYLNGNAIPGATGINYVALQSGNYNVIASYTNGCEVEAVIFDVIAFTGHELSDEGIELYPNPVNDKLFINYNRQILKTIEISFYDELGSSINLPIINSENGSEIDVSSLSDGIYFLLLKDEYKFYQQYFIKL
jgi:PKD repeat protein